MTERIASRTAGVTRITVDPLTYPVDLPDVDLSSLTSAQLIRIARDRGLDETGSDAVLRARIAADMTEFDVEV